LIARLYYFWGGNQMAGRDGIRGNNQSRNAKVRRRRVLMMGGAVGACMAAAAMATGSAAPAKADFDDLLDPIIQPLVTSLSDAIAGFDPAAATDLTSWTDSLLSSLNSIDLGAALPSTAEPAASAALPAAPDPTTYDIPITVQEDTEPTVGVSVDGSTAAPVLVDTGSSGLVIPSTDLSLTQWLDLGFPTGISESGYSGGVDYIYLEYNDATVDYTGSGLSTTDTPLDVEILSWPTSFSAGSPLDFQQFLADNDASGGILGIGDSGNAGPSEGPFESAGFSGVTVDIPQDELVVGSNAGTPIDTSAPLDGAPTPSTDLTETVTTSTGTPVGSGSVSDDVDSGGVYGTIPSTIDSSTLAQGDVVTVKDGDTVLYSYPVETDSDGTDEAPIVTTGTAGTANPIDSGVEPFLEEPIYINYTDDTLTFDAQGSGTA
jgi:hypothetical protein